MATATLPVIDLTPLWEVLDNLGWYDIPSDLTEIDANWCWRALADYPCDEIADLLEAATWEVMHDFAYDLRAAWAEARAEDRERRGGWW